MAYYTALGDENYRGYYDISRHDTERAARIALRKKLVKSGGDFGIVATSKPESDDLFKTRTAVPSYVIGVMREGIHPTRKIRAFNTKLPDRAYFYTMRKKGTPFSRWPEFMVGYDGSLTKYERRE